MFYLPSRNHRSIYQDEDYSFIIQTDDLFIYIALQIGRLLLQNSETELFASKLFEMVDHLNLGVELVHDRLERDQIVHLNLVAGQKAKAAIAFKAATRYFREGIDLLPVDCWQSQYDLTLALYRERIECEYIVGNFETAEQLCEIALGQAASNYDQSELNAIRLTHYQNSARYDRAIQVGLESLRLFGIDLPVHPSPDEIAAAGRAIKRQLGDGAIANLIQAPDLRDNKLQTIIRLLMNLVPPTYVSNQPLLSLAVLKMTSINLQYGNTPLSVFVYAWYGTILCGNFDEYAMGYEFGELALALNQKYDLNVLNGKLYMSFGNFISHWRKPVRDNIPIQQHAYQSAKAVGDFSWCHHSAAFSFWQRFDSCSDLETLIQDQAKYIGFAQETELTVGLALVLQQNVLLNLAGLTESQHSLSTANLDEHHALEIFNQTNYGYGVNTYCFCRMFVLFTYGDYTTAYAISLEAERTIDTINAQYQVVLHTFFQSLIVLALYPTATEAEQAQFWQTLQTNLDKLNCWAENCPENCLAKYWLVRAETARVRDQPWEAAELYDRAIAVAKDGALVYLEVLATELAGKFYLSCGREKIAQIYLKDAHYYYERWGAQAKVKALEARYSQLLIPAPVATLPNFTSTTHLIYPPGVGETSTEQHRFGQTLDLNTVIKASQAMSHESVLDKLLSALMKILIEHTGAQIGFLILERAGEWVMEACGEVNFDGAEGTCAIRILQGLSMGDRLPRAVIHYVIRTQESVVLRNACHEGNFTQDLYIKAHQSKSILCTPLISQGHLRGVVYFENNLMTGAFTQGRLEILNALSAQAAIFIENAITQEELNQLPRRKRTGYANRFAPKPQIWIAIRFFRCKQRGMYPY